MYTAHVDLGLHNKNFRIAIYTKWHKYVVVGSFQKYINTKFCLIGNANFIT